VYIIFMIIGHDFDEDMTLWVFWAMELEQGYAGLAFSRRRL
jgi:hypothetical protein